MCIEHTDAMDVLGAGHSNGASIRLGRAVVAFTHPMDLELEHALCIDFRAAGGDPSKRIAVELDEASARRLADAIVDALDRVS
jgi:hypothetical protein